jgi:glycosyltransferase involved in cell wall biosynthesis
VAAAWRPDVVQAEFHVMGQYLPRLRGCRALVLVEHEPGAAAARDRAKAARGPVRVARRVDARAWRGYERRVLAAADTVVAFTERDRAELSALAAAVPIARIPFGADLPAEPLDPLGVDPPRILFVGNLNHPPNAQAALDLAHGIAPAVRRRRPDVVVDVVGEAPRALARRLRAPGVVVTGVVPDVRPYVDRAAVVAVPARLGGGMRVKVVQTLAAGKALVATARAVEGLDLVSGEHAVIAETDGELASAIAGLLDDPERRRALAGAARAWAGAHLRWDEVLAAYDRLYASLDCGVVTSA